LLSPFGDAENVANSGCGGLQNTNPAATPPETNVISQDPVIVYRPGARVEVGWRVTAVHPAPSDTGVRFAIHYAENDSFEDNVLLGGIGGGNYERVPAHEEDSTPGSAFRATVILPEGKTCLYCTLQWTWASASSDAFYMGCLDLSITDDGELPIFPALGQEGNQVGNEIATGRVVDANGNTIDKGSGGGNSNAGVIAGVIIALLAAAVIGFFVYTRCIRGGMMTMKKAPPPPGGGALPPGWGSAVDPASGRMYYVNSETGQTSWDPPMAPPGGAVGKGGPPGPPGPPGGGGLPAGWTASVDPASGTTYYVNSITGVTQWEPPASRV